MELWYIETRESESDGWELAGVEFGVAMAMAVDEMLRGKFYGVRTRERRDLSELEAHRLDRADDHLTGDDRNRYEGYRYVAARQARRPSLHSVKASNLRRHADG